MFGFINIYKPPEMTSFDVVAVLRKVSHIRQIGHTGTLDPFAVGVLPVCIGKSTKLIEYLPDDKEYIADVQFGKNTDTYDLDGEITRTFDKKVSKDDVLNALVSFQGEIEQFPPIYSAIKVKGKKLYEYAREGKEVDIKPRKVFISKIELLSFEEANQQGKILVACSKGTYIRSIAYDLGKILGCGAFLKALERTKAGMFNLKTAVKLENIKSIDDIAANLINPVEVLPQTKYNLNDKEKERVSHGQWVKIDDERLIKNSSCGNNHDVVFLLYGGKMFGVGKIDNDKILVKKVFGML